MEEVSRHLEKRRRSLVSRSRLILNPDPDESWIMTDYNSKVDLRPRSMIEDDEVRGSKPPVDCVLQPSNRKSYAARTLSHITPDQLREVKLRKVSSGCSNDRGRTTAQQRDSNHTDDSTLTNNSQLSVFNYKVDNESADSIRTFKPPPPPPPPPFPPAFNQVPKIKDPISATYERRIQQLSDKINELKQDERREPIEIEKYSKEQFYEDTIADMESQLKRERDQNQWYSDRTSNELKNEVEKITSRNEQKTDQPALTLDKSFDIGREFNEGRLSKARLNNWIDELVQDKFERASKFETPQVESRDPDDRPTPLSRGRSRKESSRSRSKKRSESLASFKSFRSNASKMSHESIRSNARSMKSVLFKRTEEEDLRSEISEDDIANINEGDTNFVDFAYSKFTIHGPFIDKELNVFHSICNEYNLAAKFTFAKRSRFARTNPAHERVYALIGSDKRSSWTNRNDWTQAINNLQVLDFIFRRAIRSRSRTIKEPVMVLEHFTEGSTLDSRRFKCVMRSIFKKRDHLMLTLGIEMTKFEDIR